MKKPTFYLILLAAAIVGSSAVRAQEYTLNYTFGGDNYSEGAGSTLKITFDGTLQGNDIYNVTDVNFVLNGVSSAAPYGNGVISLDGSDNNFFFYGYPANSYYLSGYVESLGPAYYNGVYSYIVGYTASPYQYAEDYAYYNYYGQGGSAINSSYSVHASAPDGGATVALLGLGLIGLALLRRRSGRLAPEVPVV